MRRPRNIDRFASNGNSLVRCYRFCYIFIVFVVLKKSLVHGLCCCLGAMLCVPASADLLAPNLNKSVDTIPIFDAGATATISLTHGALTTCETLKAVLVQRAAVLAEVLDEREVTACTPDANGHVGFTFSTPALVRETRLAWEFKLAEKTRNVPTSATSNSSSYRPTTHNRCVPRAASM